MYNFLVRFQNLDRRWIFVGMALSILIPMLFPVSFPFRVDQRVQDLYDTVDELPDGSKIFLSADFDPASRPELEPFFRANLHHLFRKDIQIVSATLWPSAPPLVLPIMKEIAEKHGKVYGEDWVFLGFKDGKELAIKSIGENIPKAFPKDFEGTDITTLPIMSGVRQAKDFPLIVSVSAGFPGTQEYVLQIQGQYSLDIVSSCTAVSGPDYIPFFKAGQLRGLSAGIPGSAHYEQLVFPDGPPEGTRLLGIAGYNVLSLGHLFIVLLIIAGNIAYFLTTPREEA
ncbi:MAG: hypothetical protein P8R54_00205 [Myxococcota bacterium]|nr:hypothetical protein [Myxococcota bacterium]